MPFLRNVLRDLVEKKLWPIAAGLVALLVAVPVVLGGGSAAPSAAPPAVSGAAEATASGTAAGGAVTVADATVVQRARGGKLRDPFKQPKNVAPSTATASSSATAAVAAAASSGALPKVTATITSGGGSSTTTWSTAVTAHSPAPAVAGTAAPSVARKPATTSATTKDVLRVSLWFGRTDGTKRLISDIARLTPLPSAENPFFVFLGVLDDGKTASFLVSSDATATGEGKCRPSAAQCDTIELQAGQTEYFDLALPDGRKLQYEMKLESVTKRTTTAARAAMAYARHSIAGQELVRTAAVDQGDAGLRAYHFRPSDGRLVRARPSGNAHAASGPIAYHFRPGEVAVFRSMPKLHR